MRSFDSAIWPAIPLLFTSEGALNDPSVDPVLGSGWRPSLLTGGRFYLLVIRRLVRQTIAPATFEIYFRGTPIAGPVMFIHFRFCRWHFNEICVLIPFSAAVVQL